MRGHITTLHELQLSLHSQSVPLSSSAMSEKPNLAGVESETVSLIKELQQAQYSFTPDVLHLLQTLKTSTTNCTSLEELVSDHKKLKSTLVTKIGELEAEVTQKMENTDIAKIMSTIQEKNDIIARATERR